MTAENKEVSQSILHDIADARPNVESSSRKNYNKL